MEGIKKDDPMKFTFIKAALTASVLMTTCFNANAGFVSGTHTTAEGKVVDLQGLEWMSLEHTVGISRDDIEDGFTDRYGTTWNAGEWSYATREQTETLLTSLWGGQYSGQSTSNYDGAEWFISNFGGIGFDNGYGSNRIDGTLTDRLLSNYDFTTFYFGERLECSTNIESSCLGVVEIADNFTRSQNGINPQTGLWEETYVANSGAFGSLDEYFGLDAGFSSLNANTEDFQPPIFGSLLIRNTIVTSPADNTTAVPEPSTLATFALGIMGLASRRFKK